MRIFATFQVVLLITSSAVIVQLVFLLRSSMTVIQIVGIEVTNVCLLVEQYLNGGN